jgi:predicted Zn-dependent peptidase
VPRLFLALLAVIAAGGSVWAAPLELPVSVHTVRNGLRVLVHEDHSAPVISSYIFFRAGSRNEKLGQTGIAHLFEHMMFNGGKKFGPGVFDDLIEGNGGSTNGYTTRDYTAYLNNFPKEALPIVLDLESDRMWHLAITPANLKQERGIVMEERRLRVDNDVEGAMNEQLYLHAFERSPYRWNPVGFMADIEQITLEEAKTYFGTYYAPNNAVLVLSGDVEPAAAFKLVDKYFGNIPSHTPPPPVNAAEPPQFGERRITLQKQAELPSVLVGWQAVRALDPDRAALDVVSKLLTGGDSARLDEDLVRKHELVTSVGTDLQWGIDTELFYLYAQARPGKTVKAIVDRIDAVLADMTKTPVTPAELATAKRQLRADYVKGLKTVGGKANQLGFFDVVFGDYKALFTLGDSWEPVTAEDVQRAIGKYLIPSHRNVVELQPTGGAQ